jgi:hypothetical protein
MRTRLLRLPLLADQSKPYATRADFLRILHEEMNGLYLLAYLLTADWQNAEGCLVCSLEAAMDGWSVFRDCARGWVRRLIIQSATRPHRLAPLDRPAPRDDQAELSFTEIPPELNNVVYLPTPERCVFVLTVLEKYPDQECLLLLRRNRHDVMALRIRALKLLAGIEKLERHEISFRL